VGEHGVKERVAEAAGEVVLAFGPVEAGSGEGPTQAAKVDCLDIEPLEGGFSEVGEVDVVGVDGYLPILFHGGEECDSDGASQMVIAGAGEAQCVRMTDSGCWGWWRNCLERLDGVGDI
jgi:hypothetical protein